MHAAMHAIQLLLPDRVCTNCRSVFKMATCARISSFSLLCFLFLSHFLSLSLFFIHISLYSFFFVIFRSLLSLSSPLSFLSSFSLSRLLLSFLYSFLYLFFFFILVRRGSFPSRTPVMKYLLY